MGSSSWRPSPRARLKEGNVKPADYLAVRANVQKAELQRQGMRSRRRSRRIAPSHSS